MSAIFVFNYKCKLNPGMQISVKDTEYT